MCITHWFFIGELALFALYIIGFVLYEMRKKAWNRRPILMAIFAYSVVSLITVFFQNCAYDIWAMLLNAGVGISFFIVYVVQLYIGVVRSRKAVSVDEAMLTEEELNAPPIEDEEENAQPVGEEEKPNET